MCKHVQREKLQIVADNNIFRMEMCTGTRARHFMSL